MQLYYIYVQCPQYYAALGYMKSNLCKQRWPSFMNEQKLGCFWKWTPVFVYWPSPTPVCESQVKQGDGVIEH